MKRNNDESIDMTELTKTRMEQLWAVMEALAHEIDALGMHFAAVVRDPQVQSEEATRLFYVGNVKRETGSLMMKNYLDTSADPDVRITTTCSPLTSTFVPPQPN